MVRIPINLAKIPMENFINIFQIIYLIFENQNSIGDIEMPS